MNITMGIFYHFLKDRFRTTTNLSPERDYPIKKFRIWNGEKPKKEILYLSNSLPDPQWDWEDCCCLIFGELPITREWRGHFIHISLPSPDISPMISAVNTANEIMEHYNDWILYVPESGDALTDLIKTFERITGWPALLVDKNLHYLAISRNYLDQQEWFDRSNLSEMPLEAVNELMTDTNFVNAIYHQDVFFFQEEYDKHARESHGTVCCYNIRIDGRYEARLLVQAPDKKKHRGQLSLTRGLGQKLQSIMENTRHSGQDSNAYEFYRVMNLLLQGKHDSSQELEHTLSFRGWKRDHVFQVLLFSFMEEGNGTVTKEYYQKIIEVLGGESISLPTQEGILCIRNLTLSSDIQEDIRQRLSVFLRDNLCKAGISRSFRELLSLPIYYREAQIALQMGTASGRAEWHYYFDDHVLAYLLEQATGSLPRRELLHPAYGILEAYDKKKNAELLSTARAYMDCHYNVTTAAKQLNIHRTSMLFRLDRIKALTGFDWNSQRDCLHLAISFALMETKFPIV